MKNILFALSFLYSINIFGFKSSPNLSNGDWNAINWLNSIGATVTPPSCGDEIIINGTVKITTDIDFSSCVSPIKITINGTLDFAKNGIRLRLPSNSIIIINIGGKIIASGTGAGASNFLSVGSTRVWSPSGGSALYNGNPFNGPFSYPTVLGVTFESVKAENQNNITLLSWSVSDQINNSFFIIEKSTNATEWKIINSVNGDSSLKELKTFNYLDFETTYGVQYYRIKQVDFDGEYKYSEIVSIESLKPLNTKLYPNPAKDYVYIESSSLDERFTISNEIGDNLTNEVEIVEVDNFHYQIDVSKLKEGVYLIRLNNSFLKLYKQ
jgi:hypothetical protein